MRWLNVPLESLQRPEYTAATSTEVGVWLRLTAYCATQENGGKIKDCADWIDRQWLIAAGLNKEETRLPSKLWKFEGDTLVVACYPVEKEKEVAAKRKGGRKGAKMRWNGKHGACAQSTPDNSANGSAIG